MELMGIATIMILLGHSVFYGDNYVDYGFLNDFITLGYSGVDIFLFLSGFGLTHSIGKNDKVTFWKHRINRLFPSCLCIWLLYILLHIRSFSIKTPIEPFFMVYLGGYWYIGFLLIVYFLFPILFFICIKTKWQSCFSYVTIVVNSMLSSVRFQWFCC